MSKINIHTAHSIVTSAQHPGNGEISGVLHSGVSEIGVKIVTTTKDCLKKYSMEGHVGKGLPGEEGHTEMD